MQLSILAVATNLLALSSATPANPLFAGHNECDYTGVVGGIRYTGTCTKAGNYGAGNCNLPDNGGSYGCDFQWHNNEAMTPCGDNGDDATQSQFACKNDGDACWMYSYASNSTYLVVHCTNQ
ncbi:Uu.00g033950.m01.CDS01 [Anthostomella pinea]|uniref:Uu.00g033950.m01.CDS01 n=1 Tax=Anthostomella pinea TaxID=933095 RepID=A0AAI8V9G4_9PEZI|nr:Uu.00g033950.m01.CDS01 [Anthostomella pinea]